MPNLKFLHEKLFGAPLDPFNPKTRHHVVLMAFLAWVGLGADGLSSACYGPEEAFLALGSHTHLGLYLAIVTAITVFVISVGYNQVIELFPSGGGGYKVATKLIGERAGLVSGAALMVDYVLTIAISVASGMDAVSSNVHRLAEPRVKTGKWTMFYMAASLAFTAGGIVLLYLLWGAHAVEGKTLNAVTFGSIIGTLGWNATGANVLLATVLM